MNSPICPYCDKPVELVNGDVIYPHRFDLALLKFYRCAPCDAHVGCHKAGSFMYMNGRKITSDGTLPMGRLANRELRAAKQQAHAAFDPIWRDANTPRRTAYLWLSQALGLAYDKTHIGEFNLAQCRRVVELCAQREKV